MKIVITGSLGNISKPLTQTLVQKGHLVTVISSKPDRQKDIEALGAKAAIGSIEDVDFPYRSLRRCRCGVLHDSGFRILL